MLYKPVREVPEIIITYSYVQYPMTNTSYVSIVSQASDSSTEAHAEWSREPPDKCHQLPPAHTSRVPTSHTFIYVLQLTHQQQLPHGHVCEVQYCSFMVVANLEYA